MELVDISYNRAMEMKQLYILGKFTAITHLYIRKTSLDSENLHQFLKFTSDRLKVLDIEGIDDH